MPLSWQLSPSNTSNDENGMLALCVTDFDDSDDLSSGALSTTDESILTPSV